MDDLDPSDWRRQNPRFQRENLAAIREALPRTMVAGLRYPEAAMGTVNG